jgi:hypothetical protein
MRHNVIKQSTKLITSLKSKRYRPSDILIQQQNLYAPHSQQCTSRQEAQSSEPVNKSKNLPVLLMSGFIWWVSCFHSVWKFLSNFLQFTFCKLFTFLSFWFCMVVFYWTFSLGQFSPSLSVISVRFLAAMNDFEVDHNILFASTQITSWTFLNAQIKQKLYVNNQK